MTSMRFRRRRRAKHFVFACKKQERGISKSNVPNIRKYLFASASSVPYPSLASSAFRHSDSRAQSEYFAATIVRSILPIIVRHKEDNTNKTDDEGYARRGRGFHLECTCVFGSISGADGFSMKEFPLGSSRTIVKGRSMPKNIMVIFWRTSAIFAVATGSISCLVFSVEQHKKIT
jgi:hypothetical protein